MDYYLNCSACSAHTTRTHFMCTHMYTQTRKDNSQESRRKHISNTIDVHYQQLRSLHEIRADHLNREHASEWDNQLEYSKKAEKRMRKKHVLELKEHPKILKVSDDFGFSVNPRYVWI